MAENTAAENNNTNTSVDSATSNETADTKQEQSVKTDTGSETKEPEKAAEKETDNKSEESVENTFLDDDNDEKDNSDKEKVKPEPLTVDSIKYPDGVEPNAKEAEEYVKIANELNLTQEQAQKIFEHACKVRSEERKNTIAEAKKTLTECSKHWAEESKKKFANNWEEVISTSKESYKKYATKGFMEIMKKSGLGNNPDVIETFYNIGKALRSDRVISNSTPEGKPKSGEYSRWY